MGSKLFYTVLWIWVKSHATLPMRLLYILSDILYTFIYYVIGYRKKVVRTNMAAAFPEKSTAERLALEKAFYHHFSDYVVETIKLAHISLEEVQRRAYIENPEVVDEMMAKGHPCCLLLMGHYGNWEWYSASTTRFKEAKIYQLYRPLKSKAVDDLFIYLRTKFGAFVTPKNDAGREVIRLQRNNVRSVVIFLADQTPSRNNLHYWTSFLHQDTAILTGVERLARKLNLPVIFLDVKMVSRGYYSLEMQLLSENSKETPENWLTEEYARRMEHSILRDPRGWLWTHKRWKYKRSDSTEDDGDKR